MCCLPYLAAGAESNGALSAIADFRGVLGITKKVFFDHLKNTVFLQILKTP
jgi:hypothetical protein